jgi:hypothetical protein
MRVTITTLASWSGIHRDTIRRRLSPLLSGERGEQVDSTQALPMLYGEGERLDQGQERARLDRIRRELAELEFEQRQSRLVDASGVERAAFQFGRILQKNLVDVFPSRVAMEIAGMDDPWQIEQFIRERMRTELAAVSTMQVEDEGEAEPAA